jgi:tetratricopeptide (TPR) repeat protein
MRYFSAATVHRRRGRLAGSLAASLTLVALAGASHAAPPEATPQDRAQIAYQEALKLYKSGQYRAAVDKLVEARKLDPTAKELPYNLGLLYEKLGEIDNAIKNFELYLTLETDDEEKERVRATLQRLEGARAELNRNKPPASASASAEPPPPPPPSSSPVVEPPPPPPRKGRLDALVYGTGGLALVAAGAGVFFGVRALSLRPEASTADQSIETLEDRQRRAHQSGLFADISFGVALASGGAAALLYFLREAPPSGGAPAAFVSPTRGGGLVGWGGRF